MKNLFLIFILISLCGCVHVNLEGATNCVITIHDNDAPDIKTSIPLVK